MRRMEGAAAKLNTAKPKDSICAAGYLLGLLCVVSVRKRK
jgi:hypothetical protein